MKSILLALLTIVLLTTGAQANDITSTTDFTAGGSTFFGATHTDPLAFTDTFTFTISGALQANAALITIAELPGSNIDFTSATLNGNAFTFSPNTIGVDTGSIAVANYTGPLTLIVHGTTDAGTLPHRTASYAGTLNALAVPEPMSLLLVGLGVVGLALWRKSDARRR